jgi:hypothetical protein
MKKVSLLIVVLMMLLGQMAQAQDGYPTAYETVYSAPESGMLPLNTECVLTVYTIGSGAWVANEVPATIDAYIVWVNPARPAEYHLIFNLNNVDYFLIYSRDTLRQNCVQKAAVSARGKQQMGVQFGLLPAPN